MSSAEIIQNLKQAVVELDIDRVQSLAKDAVRLNVDPAETVEGLSAGIRIIGDRFGAGEAFLSELIMAAETMKAGLEVLRPVLLERKLKRPSSGVVAIGTVHGDVHDIGKNIVATMLEAAGFEVIDLGVDVPAEKFIEQAKQSKAQIVAMSALLTTTVPEQKTVIELLTKAGIRKSVSVAVGGAAASSEWAREIGADGYSDNAVGAVEVFRNLVNQHSR
jgi:corrinoid protein of di/trimethylamine methyltransferase